MLVMLLVLLVVAFPFEIVIPLVAMVPGITVFVALGTIIIVFGTASGIALLATSRFGVLGITIIFAGGLVPVSGPGVIGGVVLDAAAKSSYIVNFGFDVVDEGVMAAVVEDVVTVGVTVDTVVIETVEVVLG